jgi:hypothetical protein
MQYFFLAPYWLHIKVKDTLHSNFLITQQIHHQQQQHHHSHGVEYDMTAL